MTSFDMNLGPIGSTRGLFEQLTIKVTPLLLLGFDAAITLPFGPSFNERRCFVSLRSAVKPRHFL